MTTQPPGPPSAAAGETDLPTPPPRRWAGLFHHHDFRQLWIGDTISQFGTQLSINFDIPEEALAAQIAAPLSKTVGPPSKPTGERAWCGCGG